MLEIIAFFTLIIFTAKVFLCLIAGMIILSLEDLLDYYFDLKNKKKTKIYYIVIMAIYFLLGSIISIIFQYF